MVRCQATASRTGFGYRLSVLELRLRLTLTVYLTVDQQPNLSLLGTISSQSGRSSNPWNAARGLGRVMRGNTGLRH